MDRNKRQGNFCHSFEQKSSRNLSINQSLLFLETFEKKKISCIENFSNEIFYEIFDYLDGYDIYEAFSNLNHRFENLLISSSLSMKIEISSETLFDFRYEQFLKSNKHRIVSLDFYDQLILNQFITLCMIDSSFNRLESIVLNEISTCKLLVFLFYLKSLPYLSSLNVCLNNCRDDMGDIYQIIYHLSLKYLNLYILECEELVITLPIAIPDRFSSNEYLVIGHACTLNKLTHIFSYTPQLSRLHCDYVIDSDDNIDSEVLIKLTNLVHLKLILYGLDFDELEPFLVKLCFKLQLLNITIERSEESFLDADRWEYLILQHMTHLNNFIFCCTDINNKKLQINPFHSLIDRFTSSFWVNRKWIFKILLEMNQLIYSIRPYKETWIDFQECLHINQDPINDIVNSSNSYLPAIEFIVSNTRLTEKDEREFNKMNSILDMIKITCLNIYCDKMSVSMLIKFLNALPNLCSIRISDLPLCKLMDLNVQDIILLNGLLKNNKITKLVLRNISMVEQIDFMLDFFPRVQHFGLEDVLDVGLEIFLRCILLNIKENNISHPMTICIISIDAKYDKVETLHEMIDLENLRKNYTIHRQLNRFYLQWK